MNRKTLLELYQHLEWADAAVWRAVLAHESGRTDPKLRDYLSHLHLTQHAFLRVWQGESQIMPFPTFADTPSVLAWGRAYYREAVNYLETLREEQLAAPLPLPWAEVVAQRIGHPPEISTIGETVLQVALHSTYHRGQINARLRESGGTPPLVDYIAWIWFGRPEADWTIAVS